MTLERLDVPIDALFSTLGRTAARTLETKIVADAMQGWYDQLLANIKAGDADTIDRSRRGPRTWPSRASGEGFMEAPRDAQGQPRPYEAALAGHRLADPVQPIEILRTIQLRSVRGLCGARGRATVGRTRWSSA